MRLALFIIVIVMIILIGIFTDAWRKIRSVYLILYITPYEQLGRGDTPPTILILGDSTGYGTGAGRGDKSIAGLIGADFPEYRIVNESKNSRTINGALEKIKTLDPNLTYVLILLQIGANDIIQKRDADVVRQELVALYIEAQKRSPHVVMVSSGNVGTSATFMGTARAGVYDRLSRQFRELFISVAHNSGVVYVDLFQETDEDDFLRDPETYLAVDGLHPTAAGYAMWYQKLGPVVRETLNSNSAN